jgi:hypothetical protein
LNSQGTRRPEDDEDTLELELTPKEMRRLSQAGRVARKKGLHHWPVALAVALLGIATAVGWRSGLPLRGAQRVPPSPVTTGPPPAAAEPAALPVTQVSHEAQEPPKLQKPQEPPESQGPPVRVRNPFDASEVFEFPAGTPNDEAQQRVSVLLLQRAADRGAARETVGPANEPGASQGRAGNP